MNKKTRALLEAALVSTLTCVIGIICVFVPFMALFMFFVTIPLVVIARRQAALYAILSLAVSFLILFIVIGPVSAVPLVLLPGLPALATGIGMNRGWPLARTLGAGFAAAMVMCVLMFAFVQAVTGMPIHQSLQSNMQTVVEMSDYLYERVPGLSGADLEAAKERLKESVAYSMMLIPAVLLMWSGGTALLNYFVASKILSRIGDPVAMLPPFRAFRLPRNISMGVLLMLLLTMLSAHFQILDPEMITANVMMLVQFTFAVQGLAVAVFAMHFYRVSKIIKIIILFFLILTGYGLLSLMFAGMLDILLDFRKRLVNRAQK